MVDPMTRYRKALAAFAVPGNRWNAKGPLTYWAKASGKTAEDLIEDAHAAGVADQRFRADAQALHPLIGTRLPGVTRRDNGRMQELIFLNPAARAHAHTHGTGA